ncbi:LytTR family DNA-binding domain-containing protein [Alteromonas sp. CYL-A6]|uniref:LytTR family DNA-binding domain-containing protein n=1 Tax=Alteromonas nitratireducens TaxID=3390813 RepID=UPI0034AB3DE2
MAQSAFLTWYLKHKWQCEVVLLTLFFIVNIVANGYVAYVEKAASNIALWKPWIWEFSSAISVLILLPGLIWLSDQYPLRTQAIREQLFRHVLASIVFCAAHLALMVAIRVFVYKLVDEQYIFDWSATNLLYEYAKDIRVYLFFIVLFETYRFIIRRWRGEASKLATAPDFADGNEVLEPYLSQVLVKMLNQEFLIKLSQVEFIRTAGNYQDLYVKGRAYPFRITQSALLSQLDPTVFVKINRSEIVNINTVVNFSKQSINDAKITLIDGSELSVHKNYIDKLPERLRVVEV